MANNSEFGVVLCISGQQLIPELDISGIIPEVHLKVLRASLC